MSRLDPRPRPYPNRDRARRQLDRHFTPERNRARVLAALKGATVYDTNVSHFGCLKIIAIMVTDGGMPSPDSVRWWEEAKRVLWRADLSREAKR